MPGGPSIFAATMRRLGLATRASPSPDPLGLHPGLVVPAPDPPLLPRRPDRRRVRGRIVADSDVFADYTGAITRDYTLLDWTDGPPGVDRTMGVFEVAGGIVTRGYLTVDPRRGHLFINHGYNSLPALSGSPGLARGGTFELTLGDTIDLPGRIVVIGGPYEANYYHGLLNWFCRFVMLAQMAPDVAADPAVGYLIDARAREEPFVSILAALGIAPERIVWSDERRDYRIEHAILVSFVHEGLLCADVLQAMAETIRATLGIDRAPRGRRRLWIGREHFSGVRRRILNIDEIVPILDAHGFERVILEELTFGDQVKLFSEAEIILGSHGAGFANMIFCPADCRVLVIEKDYARMLGISRLFSSLAALCGLDWEEIPASSVRLPDVDYGSFYNAHVADAVVDPQQVSDAIERAVRRSAVGGALTAS